MQNHARARDFDIEQLRVDSCAERVRGLTDELVDVSCAGLAWKNLALRAPVANN